MITFKQGQLITLPSGVVWEVRAVRWEPDTGRLVVGLVDPSDRNHNTAFHADVLASLGIKP